MKLRSYIKLQKPDADYDGDSDYEIVTVTLLNVVWKIERHDYESDDTEDVDEGRARFLASPTWRFVVYVDGENHDELDPVKLYSQIYGYNDSGTQGYYNSNDIDVTFYWSKERNWKVPTFILDDLENAADKIKILDEYAIP